ncbi:alanine racemase [Herbinix hemicellulosilytica]|uniref:Alanine racemase n=1 Tax=Herbinix hemicellulosilytica TaxID=1564487 RepID=A0A0H5SWJ4_HERHM|nr:alanine racemase [Herbinix hemicellulosilytica]RBP59574.1 alanine racemase [Herbinix hemicellulosilytica]CRZ34713.1 Alanine racemase 2 [Herbinix hemicellulosilytica]
MDRCDYYRAQVNINLDAIRSNINEIRRHLKKDTKLMVIVKADAYGHGAVAVSKALENGLADAFGVAIIEEAVELRKAGITKPILILGFTPKEQFDLVVSYDVIQTVYQYEMAQELSKEAIKQGKTAKIHIKVDTGMSRLGFSDSQESITEIKKISTLKGLYIEGIFSHFANADEKDKSSVNDQIRRFNDFYRRLENEGIHIPIRHMANSAGVIEFPNAQYEMVRCGIVTYGLYPSEYVNHSFANLIPAMELKSHVVYIKEVPPGTGISYGSTYITKRKTKVATIPVGYADGYSRNLSNVGKVIIRGKYAPIIGRICMDYFMVDVTDIEDVTQGDTVTLLGKDGDCVISAETLALWSHSFPYEMVCTVGKRIPRVFLSQEESK